MKKKLLDEYVIKMQECDNDPDTEFAHVKADKLLCELLEKLGYGAVTSIFKEMRKWYA